MNVSLEFQKKPPTKIFIHPELHGHPSPQVHEKSVSTLTAGRPLNQGVNYTDHFPSSQWHEGYRWPHIYAVIVKNSTAAFISMNSFAA